MAGPIDRNKPEITIFVYNTARVSLPDLALAEQHATMIFRQAGIATAWVNCSAASLKETCQPAGRGHIVAHGKTSSHAVFGLAFLGTDGNGKYSDVFYERIDEDASRLLHQPGPVAGHGCGS